MKIKFLFLGRTREMNLDRCIQDYLRRIRAYVPAEEIVIKGLRARDELAQAIRTEESRRLLAALKPDDLFVHLDPEGRELTSLELADWLKIRRDRADGPIAFGLGGPQGLDGTAAARADLRLCLSRMTLTHEMCRLVLVEQVYRAMRILAGHPYHK